MEKNLLIKIINKACDNDNRRKKMLIKDLAIDLKNSKYEIYYDKYTKNYYGSDIFLYVDKDFNLVAVLLGDIYQNKFENYSCFNKINGIEKNKFSIEKHSKFIIKIKYSERYYKQRYNKKYSSKIEGQKTLEERLNEFKMEKAAKCQDEVINQYEKELMEYFTKNLNSELSKTFKEDKYFNNSYIAILSRFINDMTNYEEAKHNLYDEKERNEKYNRSWSQTESRYYVNYANGKRNIIRWHKRLQEET